MSFPLAPIPVPDVVARIAAGRPSRAVWVNELGGVTFSISEDAFVKVYPAEHAALLDAESDRLRWASAFAAVPHVIEAGPGWLHTAALPGRSAVDPRWVGRPEEAARAIGAGLRRFHDVLPVDGFPFGRPSWVPADAPAADRLVVCQGDACAPNTLIGDDGRCSGHVDLGDLGVADRWADLAVATMSLAWNFGTVHEAELFAAYGVTPDHDRIAYYRGRWAQ
ncbi:phosphotransferase [Mycobacterium sp. NPDC006124]|uniref:phosphotransferase n=1 Tax=Mycobacterium sp. NPDC006124 TaxID=3156729 RepID=UPI0033A0EDD7